MLIFFKQFRKLPKYSEKSEKILVTPKKGPHLILVQNSGKILQKSGKILLGRIRKIWKNTNNLEKCSENPEK